MRPFARVPAALPGDQVVALLRDKRAHQAAVVDTSGAVVGFITIQDVLSTFLGVDGAAIVTVALITLGLLLANAFFVAAEFAVIGVSRPSVTNSANRATRMAARVLGLLTSPVRQDRFIATAQIGITLASLGLGMYGEHTFAAWLEPRLALSPTARFVASHTLASVLAVAALTYLHIFLGEMVPKAIALSHANQTVRLVYWPMYVTFLLFYPFVTALNAMGNFVLRLVGIDRKEETGDHVYSAEELQIIVEESSEGGAMRAESGTILRELLEFGDRTAGEAMVPRVRVVGIPVNADAARVREIVLENHHTRYPIYDGDLDHIVGMLHVKDLLRRILANAPDFRRHSQADAGGAGNGRARCRARDDAADPGSPGGGRRRTRRHGGRVEPGGPVRGSRRRDRRRHA